MSKEVPKLAGQRDAGAVSGQRSSCQEVSRQGLELQIDNHVVKEGVRTGWTRGRINEIKSGIKLPGGSPVGARAPNRRLVVKKVSELAGPKDT